MRQVVSPLVPFPNMYWWCLAAQHDAIIFDAGEHFEKMTYRNRYYITGANGLIQLSIPLIQGRGQRNAMKDVLIDNRERWQVQHWRTINSVYGRAPYFEHYGPELKQLFSQEYTHLTAFNTATIQWIKKQLSLKYQEQTADEYVKEYQGGVTDIRKHFKPRVEKQPVPEQDGLYYQLFTEKNGFYRNLSLLDILFVEGPVALTIIKQYGNIIAEWK